MKIKKDYVIIIRSEKETGENPVRARRREAQNIFFLSVYRKTETKPLEKSEKAEKRVLSRNIFQTIASFRTAGTGYGRKKLYFF